MLQVAEKDLQIFDSKEKIKNLEESLCNLRKEYDHKETCVMQERNEYQMEIKELKNLVDQLRSNTSTKDYQRGKSEANVGDSVRI